jgi:N-acylneuraminate cytidylyltransferase
MKILYVIPARGGSKGIPHKNIKPLNGKPLIYYSIDVARQLTTDENICVSTDDDEIIEVVERYGLKVPFKRPDYLATDTATTNDVLLHAIDFYESNGIYYDVLVLLQPTSPLRKASQVEKALSLYNDSLDMVVSVKESHAASVICKENENGFLEFCFNKSGLRRQDTSSYYEYNGAIYIINIERLKEKSLSGFTKIKKYVMDELSSVDIDIPLDWIITEEIIKLNRSLCDRQVI